MTITTGLPTAPPTGTPACADYAAGMVRLVLYGIQQMRDSFTTQLAKVEEGEHTVITRHGKPVGAFVPMDWYRQAREALGDPTELQ
jgi:prevent-host-death family protein